MPSTDTDTPIRPCSRVDLAGLVSDLAVVRRERARLQQRLDEARAEFDSAHREQIDALGDLTTEMQRLDAKIRAHAVARYRDYGEKSPVPGVSVRVATAYDVHEEGAWNWIDEHQMRSTLTRPATLDMRAITDLARAMALPFVVLRETATATIVRDLDAALEREVPIAVTSEIPRDHDDLLPQAVAE